MCFLGNFDADFGSIRFTNRVSDTAGDNNERFFLKGGGLFVLVLVGVCRVGGETSPNTSEVGLAVLRGGTFFPAVGL